jgi:type VI secretion system protein ImpC
MNRDDRYRVLLDVDSAREADAAVPAGERPFHILLLGDFGGSDGALQPRQIDRDELDEVLASFRPSVRLPLGEEGAAEVRIEFRSIDDFHPDELMRRVPLLMSLAELREQARAGRLAAAPPTPRPPGSASSQSAPTSQPSSTALPAGSGGGLLDRILDEAPGESPPRPDGGAQRTAESADPSDLHAWLRGAVAPHLSRPSSASEEALLAQIEEALAAALRAILHHPRFQALEAAWRGAHFLVRRLETDSRLKVFALHLPRVRLETELDGGSELLRVIGSHSADRSWALLAGLYEFDGSPVDAQLLARVGAVARAAGVPFIAGAAPRLAGARSFAAQPDAAELEPEISAAWQKLRRTGEAAYLGLIAPRFLLRLPYDPREEPCETLSFDELGSTPAHEDYLWASPALAAALLLGESFAARGWHLRPDDHLEVRGLPLHVYRADGTAVTKPCAETLITERVALRLMDAGLMPLLSQRGGDVVRLAVFQSIADPATPLEGPWQSSMETA